MILTITLNPAVDISYKLEHFSLDTVNRVAHVSKTAGGKGLNVARVLRQLEEEVAASGFLGGGLGNFIRSQIGILGIRDFFVQIADDTRNCIAVIHEGKQTEILESGPVISDKEAMLFLEKFACYVEQADIVTLSGSLPKGLSADFYVEMVKISKQNGVRVLLDSNASLLAATITSSHKPYFIKPNVQELEDLVGEQMMNETQIKAVLGSTLFADIPWVVVTLGANGAIVKHGDIFYRVKTPKIEAINPVGSGDSVVAGFAGGVARGLMDEDLIKFSLSMGVLNAMEEKTGHINVKKVAWAIEQIQVEKIKG